MTVTNALLRAYQDSKRKKPPRIYPPAVVPGYGQYVQETARNAALARDARHDRSQPRTKQQAPIVHAPYNPQGDYRHPRRPRPRARWN